MQLILARSLSERRTKKKKETQKSYETDKKKCLDKIDDHENIVVLSLVVESSIEASFQVRPLQIIVTFTSCSFSFFFKLSTSCRPWS